MKFIVEKSSFLEALTNVQNAVPARGTLQILSNAKIEAVDGSLIITTTNLDMSIRCTVTAKVDEPGATTLPIKRLVSIVRELANVEIEVSVDANNTAAIKSGSSFFKISGLSTNDFPKVPEAENKICFSLNGASFKEMLRKTSYAVSEDESRRIITGVLLAFKDGKLTVVATDGRRLALAEQEVEFPAELETEIVLPSKTVSELLRLIKEDGDIKIYDQKTQAIFEYHDTTLSTKLIEGSFPNYRQVIPSSFEDRVEVMREDFLSAMRRVSIISADDKTVPTLLTFSEDQLIITMQNPEVGESRETVVIKYAGKDAAFTFNPEYVMDPLRAIESENIIIEISGGHGPVTFRCDEQFLYVLMPLRVSPV